MDYKRDAAWWETHSDWSGEALSRTYGGDGGSWRRAKRKATPVPDTQRLLRGVAVFDLHYPHHTKKLWSSILRFVEDFQPDVFLFGGDNLNMDPFDHWKQQKNKRRAMEGVRVKKHYAGFQAAILDKVEAVLPDECDKVFLLGNHEKWAEDYIDEHPEVEGYFEVVNNLKLSDWDVYEYGQSADVGKLHFIHGVYCLQHHAAKTVTVYHRNICAGHMHTFQAHTEITPLDADAHTATSIPCACNQNPDYARNKPNAWLNGFAVFYVMPDGDFNLYPVISSDGKFTAPTGKTY